MSKDTKSTEVMKRKRAAVIKATALKIEREKRGEAISNALSSNTTTSGILANLIDAAYVMDGKIGPKQMGKDSAGKAVVTFGKVKRVSKVSPKTGKPVDWMDAPELSAAHDALLARMNLATDDTLYIDKAGYGNLKRDLNRATSRTAARLQGPVLRICGTGKKVPFHVECTDPVEAVKKTYRQSLQAVVDRFIKDGKTIAACSREMQQFAIAISPALKVAKESKAA